MDIETIKGRVYFLAGQLEEAKKILQDAMREIDAEAKKKQSDEDKPQPVSAKD